MASERTKARLRDWSLALVFGGTLGLGVFVLIWIVLGPVLYPPQLRELCDREVDLLLHSTELIEVTRAAAIVREIPCEIGRRLRAR